MKRRNDFRVFEKIKSVNDLLKDIVNIENRFYLRGIILRGVSYNVGRVKVLREKEAEVYDILLKNGYKPERVYKWLLLERAPNHIKEKLMRGEIGLEHAIKLSYQWRRMADSYSGKEIMEEMQRVIGGLRWKSQEELQL